MLDSMLMQPEIGKLKTPSMIPLKATYLLFWITAVITLELSPKLSLDSRALYLRRYNFVSRSYWVS